MELITRPNRLGLGIDVGYRWPDGGELWWGITRDTTSLRLLIQDARRQGREFSLAPATEALLDTATAAAKAQEP